MQRPISIVIGKCNVETNEQNSSKINITTYNKCCEFFPVVFHIVGQLTVVNISWMLDKCVCVFLFVFFDSCIVNRTFLVLPYYSCICHKFSCVIWKECAECVCKECYSRAKFRDCFLTLSTLRLRLFFFVECVFPIAFSSLFFPLRTLSSIFFLSTFFSVAVINAAYFLMRHINWLGGLGRGRGRKSNQCISLKIPCHVHSIWPENNVILIVSIYFDLEKLNSSKWFASLLN